YAAGLVKLGDLAVKRRQYGEADQFYAKAVSLGDRAEVAPALLYLAIKANQNPEAASDFLERAVRVAPRGPILGQALTWLAMMHKDRPDAEELFQRALSSMDSNEIEAATTLELYAAFLKVHDRVAEAEQAIARAGNIRRSRQTEAAVRTERPGVV